MASMFYLRQPLPLIKLKQNFDKVQNFVRESRHPVNGARPSKSKMTSSKLKIVMKSSYDECSSDKLTVHAGPLAPGN